MATRRERVVLSLDSADFTTGMAKAAASTALLDRSLNNLDGSSVKASRGIQNFEKPLGDTDRSLRKTDQSINQLTGRLRLFADVAATIGPALVPLGAGGLGAIVGLSTQFTALAGGIGVSVAAFAGMGDALKAVSKAQLEPTAQNLAAMRLEMEKMGPAGAEFVMFLDSIGPQLRELQYVAREGLLPGVQDGIESLLRMTPQVKGIIADLALTMGDLARRSGEALSGDAFAGFFDYLDNQAGPLLMQFGDTIGNVFEGVANLIVGFAPVTSSFSMGMERMTASFAEWSRGLGDNAGFQEFISYIQRSGPQAVEFLGAMVDALAGLVRAAAPLGSAILPVLTSVANAFAAIANSPIGTPLLTAAAAFATFNRASQLASTTAGLFTSSLDRMGVSTDKVSGSLGKVGKAANAAGMALAAIAIGDSLQRQFEGLDTGLQGVTSQLLDLADSGAGAKLRGEFDNVAESFERLTDPNKAQAFQDSIYGTFSFLGSDSRVDEAKGQIEALDAALANIASSGSSGEAQAAFDSLARSMGLSAGETQELLSMLPQYRDALSGAENAARLHAAATDESADAARREAQAVEASRQALLAKRQATLAAFDAETQWRQALNDATDAQKRNTAGIRGSSDEALDNRQRLSALAAAWNNQSDAVRNNEARQRAARAAFIDAARGMGVSAEQARNLANRLLAIPTKRDVQVRVLADAARTAIDGLKSALDGIPDEDVRINITTVRREITSAFGSIFGSADGSTVPKDGGPYGDRYPYLLAPGEEVISNRYGQADRHRDLLKAINSNRLADGGTVGRLAEGGTARRGSDRGLDGVRRLDREAARAADRLKGMRNRLQQTNKELEKDRDRRRQLREDRSQLSSTVAGNFRNDIFGNGLEGAMLQLRADTNDAVAFSAAMKRLDRLGLSGGAERALFESGDLTTAQQLAAGGRNTIRQFERLYATRQDASGGVGARAGAEFYGRQIAQLNREIAKGNRIQNNLERQIKKLGRQVKAGAREGTREGARKGANDRNTRTAQRARNGR